MGKLSKLKRRFYCTFCDKSFLERRQLEDHTHTHTREQPYFCSSCDASFRNRNNRRNHEKLVHLGIWFKCNLCSELFKYQTDYCKHRNKIHNRRGTFSEIVPNPEKINETTGIITLVPTEHSRNKRYSCLFCDNDKVYKEYRALEMHTNLHTGEKPYNCPNCSKSFYSRFALRDHIRKGQHEKESSEAQTNKVLTRKKTYLAELSSTSNLADVNSTNQVDSDKNPVMPKWDESFFLHLNRYVPGT